GLGPAEERSGASHQFNVAYRFVHDRVQQAAYSLIIEEDRKEYIHVQIGRTLLAKSGGSPDEDIFDVVTHLNTGAPLITNAHQQLNLACLDLAAGKKAKLSAAYEAAADIFAAGISLLTGASWEDEYDLTFALHAERAECELLASRFDRVPPLLD